MTESILFWTATTCYAAGTVAAVLWLAFRSDRAGWAARALAGLGLAAHAGALGLRWAAVGHGPYATRYEVVSADTFVLVAVWLAATLRVRALRSLAPIVLPLAFLGMGWALTSFDVRYTLPIIFRSYWLYLHIGFAKLFAATILLSAACAAAYLVKLRDPTRFPALPPPERLDLYAHQLMLASFLFLGVMIVAGSLWAAQGWGRYWGWDPIETSALVTWIVLGIILHLRVLHGWSGRRMAYLTFVGLACALATLFVVALLVPTIHNSYLVGRG
ncbi:cytochrome c biogenesis protein CcsA [Anaeromyxobacter oryzisoli]|uniref:cytochrome c biogenesis protein CcsA n=1 Tax=Anaeromyxobacter oryzisoli TaxID=2925408 RepID=UPI001F59EAE8|nr:cytochrome c biogenesis protein CcsA [Anaeromyxobacter sp. SG63]